MEGILYREATIADSLELANLRWLFQCEEENDVELYSKSDFIKHCTGFFEDEWKSGRLSAWIAEKDGEIISHAFINLVSMIPKPNFIQDQFGYLTNVYTKPQFRNQKIGATVLGKVKSWAMSKNLELLIVWPSDESISFYQHAGFASHNEIMELKLRDEI